MRSKIGKIVLMCSLVMCMAIGLLAVDVKAADTTEATAIDSCDTRKFLSYDAGTAAEYIAGENTYPKLEGYMFAGWYTKDVYAEENLLKGAEPSGTVYALFVPEHVLSVKAQVSAHLIDDEVADDDKTASIRFVTTVDSLLYQQVGFEVSYVDSNGNVKNATSASAKVYEKLYVAGTTASENKVWQVTPAQTFCGLSKYFKACTVTGVPEGNYSTEFTVRPYWITMDGDKVYGVEATKAIEDVLRKEAWITTGGTDGLAYGGANAPYATLDYAIKHVVDGGIIHIKDTYTLTSGTTWTPHGKKVTITGGTLDFSVLTRISIHDDVTFSAMNLTLSAESNTAIFAEGHALTINEDVIFTNEDAVKNGTVRVEIMGGGAGADVDSTNLKLYAGSYNIIYGGAIEHNVKGNTNVTVGKKVNTGASYTSHDMTYLLFGGCNSGTVSGNTNITVETGATFNYVYGGGYANGSTVEGTTNIKFAGSAMSIYGGCHLGTNGDTNIIMTGGVVEQIFGGCESTSMTGNTNIQILGGEVVRRIYGGCYNDTDTWGSINTSNQVTGNTNVMVGPNATISLASSGPNYSLDANLCAVSRGGADSDEYGTIIFNESSSYKDKVSGWDTSKAYHYRVLTNGNNADDSYGNVYPAGEWIQIVPKEGYVATVTIGTTVKYFTEGEGYYPLPEWTDDSSQTDIVVTFGDKDSTNAVEGDTKVAVISIADTENGTVTSEPMYCLADETVTLTVTPDEGYSLTELSVMNGDTTIALNEEVASTGGEYTFTAVEGTITVAATFEAKEYGAVGGMISGATSGSITATDTTTGEVNTFEDALYEDGSYGISLPVGTYQIYVDGGAKIGSVAAVTVTKDEVTEQNLILKNKMNKNFELTSEGYYTCTAANGQHYFVDGYGSAWVAEMTIPELNTGELAGFVLHKRNASGGIVWGNWMRITVLKTATGAELFVKMNVDGNTTLQAECTFAMSETSVEGKAFQVLLLDGELIASLDGQVIQKFTNNTTLIDGKGTMSEVLGSFGTDELYCGLFANKAGIVIPDWSFNNIPYASEKYMVSGTVSSEMTGVSLSDVTLTFANKTYEAKTYTVAPDENGNYSVQLPSTDYKVTASHTNYVDNTFECSLVSGDVTKDISLRKNAVNNANFEVTTEGYYKSTQNDTHNILKDAHGTFWEAEVTLPDLEEDQGVGFILLKTTDSGTQDWSNWMRVYIRKENNNIELFANILNNTYKTDVLSETTVEGKIFKVIVLNSSIFVTLDGEIIGVYDKDTQMDPGDYTVDGVLQLTGTNGLYCGLFAKTKDTVIKDWNFSNILDESKKYVVSGNVSVGLAAADVSATTLTFVNEEDETTYTANPDAEGNYSVQLENGDYKLTVSHDNYLDHTYECKVFYGDITKSISLRRNKIDGTWAFAQTEEGNYSCNGNYRHSIFVNGLGNAWEAELKIPSLNAGQSAGFVLHMRKSDGGPNWDSWMRILIQKTSDGNLQYVANILDNAYNIDTLSVTSVEEKVLKVSLLNNRIVVMLDEEILATYDSNTELETGKGTVGDVLGMTGTNSVYCGPTVSTKDMVLTDWNFTNVLDTSKEYTVSGNVSVGLTNAKASDATITFVNAANSSKSYSAVIDANGMYSVQLPSADYKVTVSHPNYVDNILDLRVMMVDVTKDISLRKNIVANGNFTATEDGFYQSAKNDTHNVMKGASGIAWEAEVKLPAMTDGQGAGFILIKANANGDVSWGEWMQLYIRKTNSGYELFANILNNTYKVDKLSATAVEGKIFKVTVLNGKVIALLDDEFIGIYDKDTVMDTAGGLYTVDGVLGLTGTTGLYCGLFAKTSGFVITDWNFSDVFQTEVACETSLNYQGGAIYNNNAFVFNNNGTFRVMDLANGTISGVNTLDKADVITPHANSVCFSDMFYPGDETVEGAYPLLYVNVYNNYDGQDDEHEGTCLVYRVQENEQGTFTTTLVQVIEIGFTQSDIWVSQENEIRPFGNFVVDTDNDMLYVYTLRNVNQCMRFFKFRLPEVQALSAESVSDASYNATYKCYVVTLGESDIINFSGDVQYFDVAGFPIIQDATYYQGRLILCDGSSAGTDSCIRVINPETGKEEYTLDVDSLFPDLVKEAEMISINPEDGSLYYMTTPGTLRKLKLPLVWDVEKKVSWIDGSLGTANGLFLSRENNGNDVEQTDSFLKLDDYCKVTFAPTETLRYMIFMYDKDEKYLGRYWSGDGKNAFIEITGANSYTVTMDVIKSKYNNLDNDGNVLQQTVTGEAVYFKVIIYDNAKPIISEIAAVANAKFWDIARINTQ